ncbi:MAG: M56 family metallopeptidase, partial [Angelakisella sp.]
MNVGGVFAEIFNMSITASWMILAVLLFRALLRGLPRVFSYILWLVVYFRLLCPVSFTSGVSLLNLLGIRQAASVPVAIASQPSGPVIASSIDWITIVPGQAVGLSILSALWLVGFIGMLLYSLVSFVRLKYAVKKAQPLCDNIRRCNTIDSPFILGILQPVIYLPASIKEDEYAYILQHEQIHLRRKDYIIKPVAYLALCIHWFNPLVWVSFLCMTCDMEMSCDERVLRHMGDGIKKSYSHSLLLMAAKKQQRNLHMIAFGESDI